MYCSNTLYTATVLVTQSERLFIISTTWLTRLRVAQDPDDVGLILSEIPTISTAVEQQCHSQPFVGSQVFPSKVTSWPRTFCLLAMSHDHTCFQKKACRLREVPKVPIGTWEDKFFFPFHYTFYAEGFLWGHDTNIHHLDQAFQDLCSFMYAASLLTIASATVRLANRGHWLYS